MMNINSELNIWAPYHNDNCIYAYDLFSIPNKNVKLLNVGNLEIEGKNINYLNKYFNEFTAYYYVYMNQLRSDYVGFCHYRRMFPAVDLDKIDNVNIQTLTESVEINDKQNWFTVMNVDHSDDIYFLILMFLNKYKHYNLVYDDVFTTLRQTYRASLVCTWDVFCDIAQTCIEFFNFLTGDFTIESNILRFYNLYYNYHKKTTIRFEKHRLFGYLFEFFLGIYCNLRYNHFVSDKTFDWYINWSDISDAKTFNHDTCTNEIIPFLINYRKHRKYGNDNMFIIDSRVDPKSKEIICSHLNVTENIFFVKSLNDIGRKNLVPYPFWDKKYIERD